MKNLHTQKSPKPMMQQAEMCTGFKKKISVVLEAKGAVGSGFP